MRIILDKIYSKGENMRKTLLALTITAAFGLQQAVAAETTLEQKLEILQQEIEALKIQVAKTQSENAKSSSISLASDMTGQNASAAWGERFSHGQAGNTVVGGYGEVVYNNYRDSSVKDQADLRRFVLFFGHKFSDRLRFNSELEVEHGFIDEGKPGEIAMEQAYLEYGLTDRVNLRAGLMLMPLGILNETHEPPTFYGVERNEIESRIIPSTWRELSIAVQGEAIPGMEYQAGISTAPDASKFENASAGFRGMRTSGGKAAANDLGYFASLNYRGRPGLLLGGGIFSGNTGQDGNGETPNALLKGVGGRLTVWDVHAKYAVGNLDLQALYARGKLNDTAQINTALAIAPASGNAAPKSFSGWYGQAAYHIWKSGELDLAPFVRYEQYDTQREVDSGYDKNIKNKETVTTLGVNFKVHPQVVLKADFQNYKTDNKKDRFSLGVGYMF